MTTSILINTTLIFYMYMMPIDPTIGENAKIIENQPSKVIENEERNSYIVTVNKGANLDAIIQEVKSATGGNIIHVYKDSIYGFAIELPLGLTKNDLYISPEIIKVEKDLLFKPMETGTIQSTPPPSTQKLPDGIRRIYATISETANIDGIDDPFNINIAIIDSGIDSKHPDLNVVYSKSFISGVATGEDDHGHGTHVAGIAAAKDNSLGVVGVAPGARLYSLKVLNKNNWGYLSDIIKAVDWVTGKSKPSSAMKNYAKYSQKAESDYKNYTKYINRYNASKKSSDLSKANSYLKKYNSNLAKAEQYQGQTNDNIQVVNMSIGAVGKNSSLQKAIKASVSYGVIYVVAAGNNYVDIYGDDKKYNTSDDIIPAAYPEVVTVSAMADTDGEIGGKGSPGSWKVLDDTMVGFSNRSSSVTSGNPVTSPGKGIDVAAPGLDVYSTWKGKAYATISGTSMASPHVAGAMALLVAKLGQDINKDGKINSTDVAKFRQLLIDTADPQSSWKVGTTKDNDGFLEGSINVSGF